MGKREEINVLKETEERKKEGEGKKSLRVSAAFLH
jgi:hypothetical protein